MISLAGLENLTSIGGGLSLWSNDTLISLSGLEKIDPGSITDLNISNNDLLSECDVQSICEYLAAPNGTVNIHNNASGCNGPGEIAQNCGFAMLCLPFGNYYFSSQSQIDNFQTYFPGCTELQGSLSIAGEDITSLQGLDVITSIEGGFHIRPKNIETFAAFS